MDGSVVFLHGVGPGYDPEAWLEGLNKHLRDFAAAEIEAEQVVAPLYQEVLLLSGKTPTLPRVLGTDGSD